MFEYIFGSKSVGFFTFNSVGDGYAGAILITDFKGIPMEFRCTDPIKPDAIQLSLYGSTFFPHVGVELCGKPLIHAVKNKPKFVIVNQSYLLKLDSSSPYPVILVRKTGHQDKNVDDLGSQYQIEVMKSRDNQTSAFEIISQRETIDKIQEHVQKLCTVIDIFEPFERIEKAVEIITRKNANSN
jgi:hypothetical protein